MKLMKLTEDALSELGGFRYLLSLKLRILQRAFQVTHIWAEPKSDLSDWFGG